jgi:magnesium chelatase subunit I
MRPAYPFSAIVGQEEMKRALVLSAVDPAIGGILVFGDRGTGKSTAVRGLAGLLPKIEARAGCRYNCAPADRAASCPDCSSQARKGEKRPVPVIDLPLGASEDRVAGALDIERALVRGEKAFDPGLLASAHRGYLYIDEVNLLEDHLVDLLLDVAASGINVVEREGIGIRHPARFVLVGSGNPEEGELRPQLLDRFGLAVDVATPRDIASRVEVVKRRDAYDRDADAFADRWKARDAKLRSRIWETRAERMGGTDGYAVMSPDDDARRDYARICEASGDTAILDRLTPRVAHGGEIVIAGFYDRLSFAFPPAFMKEATFRIAAEWQAGDIEAVTRLVDEGRLSLDGLLTHSGRPQDAAGAYRQAFADPNCLKMTIDWREAA